MEINDMVIQLCKLEKYKEALNLLQNGENILEVLL